VSDGDVIVFCTISAMPRHARRIDTSDSIYDESLRLADMAFLPFESAAFGASAYQQMFTEAFRERGVTARPTLATVVPEPAREVSTAPLPACWTEQRVDRGSPYRSHSTREKSMTD
jgi:hypothetical protein